jgi:hypothetical protein
VPAPQDQVDAAIHSGTALSCPVAYNKLIITYDPAASTDLVVPRRKHILDGEGEVWVSPSPPSSDEDDIDSFSDTLPMFDNMGNDEIGDTDKTIQDAAPISPETSMPTNDAVYSYPEDTHCSPQGKSMLLHPGSSRH